MFKIEVKNKGFNGERCGIGFVNGEGLATDLTPEQKTFFKSMGYTVTGNSEEKIESKEKKLEQMNKDELLIKAKELEIVIEDIEKTTKAQIVEMIKAKETSQE